MRACTIRPTSLYCSLMYLPKRDELSLRTVFAFPKASRITLLCIRRDSMSELLEIIAAATTSIPPLLLLSEDEFDRELGRELWKWRARLADTSGIEVVLVNEMTLVRFFLKRLVMLDVPPSFNRAAFKLSLNAPHNFFPLRLAASTFDVDSICQHPNQTRAWHWNPKKSSTPTFARRQRVQSKFGREIGREEDCLIYITYRAGNAPRGGEVESGESGEAGDVDMPRVCVKGACPPSVTPPPKPLF